MQRVLEALPCIDDGMPITAWSLSLMIAVRMHLLERRMRPSQQDAGKAGRNKGQLLLSHIGLILGMAMGLTCMASSVTALHEENSSVSSFFRRCSGFPWMPSQHTSVSCFRLLTGSSCSALLQTLGHEQSFNASRAGCCPSTFPSCPLVSNGLQSSLASICLMRYVPISIAMDICACMSDQSVAS